MNHLIKSAIFLPLLLGLTVPCQALTPKVTAQANNAANNAQPAPATVSSTEILAAKAATVAARIKDYRENADAGTWDAALKELRDYAQSLPACRATAAGLLQAIPSLNDLGTKFVEFSGNRVWTFTKVPESQHVILQWQNVVPGADEAVIVRGRRRIVRGAPQISWRADFVRVAPGVQIKEARIVSSVSISTVGKKTVRQESPKSLVLVGCDKSGSSYLHAFRTSGGTWNETTDVFSGVPPYVLQNLSGKASFSGNDLVLAIGGTSTSDGGDKKNGVGTASNGYRIVLKLIAGKYTLEGGKNGEDGAIAVTAQFASALQQNRPDLAKAWLADPKLISIPKYIGYFTKTAPQARIIPMANPGGGITRFRLITSLKDDLILDVGKTKNLPFAVKAVFIAPPDPLAAKILSNLQPSTTATSTSVKDKDKDRDKDKDDATK